MRPNPDSRSILLAGALLIATPAMAADVRIASEGAYAPWNYLDDSGELAGFEIDLGNELCSRAGMTCERVVNEWESIIPNLIAGNYDVIMSGMSITEERLQTMDFSADYYPPDPSLFMSMADSAVDFENLTGKSVGAQDATIQAAWLEENLAEDNTLLNYESPDQLVADLAAGNIDILLADGGFLRPITEGSNGSMAIVGPEVALGGGVGMGLRLGDTELKEQMSAALESAKADGTVDALIKEYFDTGPFYTAE